MRLVEAEDAFNEVVQSVATGGDRPRRSLRIGAAASILMGLLPELIDALEPGTSPVIRQAGEAEQARGFADGQLDVGLQRTRGERREGFIPLPPEPLYVARRASGGSVKAPESLPLAHFAGSRFLIFRREVAPVAYDAIISVIRRSGARFPIVHYYTDEGDFLGKVACGEGIGIVPESLTRITAAALRYARIVDPGATTPLSIRYAPDSAVVRSAAFALAERATALRVRPRRDDPRC